MRACGLPALALALLAAEGTYACPLEGFGQGATSVVTDKTPPTTNTSLAWGGELRVHAPNSRVWHYVKNLHRNPVAFEWPKAEMLVPFNQPLEPGHSACNKHYGGVPGFVVDHDAPIRPSNDGVKGAEAFVPTPAPSKVNGAEIERDDDGEHFARLVFDYSPSDRFLRIDLAAGPDATQLAFSPGSVGLDSEQVTAEIQRKEVPTKGFFSLSQLGLGDALGDMHPAGDDPFLILAPSGERTLEFRNVVLRSAGLMPLLMLSPRGALLAATRIDTRSFAPN